MSHSSVVPFVDQQTGQETGRREQPGDEEAAKRLLPVHRLRPEEILRMSLSLTDIQRGLLAFYRTGAPMSQTARALGLHEISDGWENEVYSFALADEAAAGAVREELI